MNILDRADDALGDGVATHDAAEDIDQDGLDVVAGQNQLEGFLDALGIGAAADVQEVGRLAAGKLDDVHGGHCQAGPVDHAGDIAVERDVIELVFAGLELGRILLRLVAHFGQLRMPKQRVVVCIELDVQSAQVAPAVNDQRVDLDQADILFNEQTVQPIHDLDQLAHLLGIEPHAETDLPGLVGHVTGGGINRGSHDFLRTVGSDLLNVDAAGSRPHEYDGLLRSIDKRAEIELLLDLGGFGHQHRVDRQRAAAGLVSLDTHAQHSVGSAMHFIQTGYQLDSPALPRPPACTWALTTHCEPPSRSAAATASSALVARNPRGTGIPYSSNRLLA